MNINNIKPIIAILLAITINAPSITLLARAEEVDTETLASPEEPTLVEVVVTQESEIDIDTTIVEDINVATATGLVSYSDLSLDQTYESGDGKLKLKFSYLPDIATTINIQEINLTDDEIMATGALSPIAYDVTTNMVDGTFAYNLSMPLDDVANRDDVAIKYVEIRTDLMNSSEIGVASSEIKGDDLVAEEVDHFTIFVLVNDIDDDDPDSPGNENDVKNGVLSAIDDTYIDQANPSDNSVATFLSVMSRDGSRNRRSLIKFDITSVPTGSAVAKATLRLYMHQKPPTSKTYEAYSLLGAWSGNTVTWNTAPTASTIASDSISTGPSSNVWLEFDVTSDVQSMINGTFINNGWLIKDTLEDTPVAEQAIMRSGDYSAALRRPQLVVDYVTPADAPAIYQSPTLESADASGNGDGFETTPAGAFADKGSEARNFNGSADAHQFYGYDFTGVPVNSTIRGIEIRADWRVEATVGLNKFSVQVSPDAGATWSTLKIDNTETSKEHIVTFGGPTDTWGRVWTVSELQSPNFRVRAVMDSTSANRDFYLDWIPARVYYTPPPPPAPVPVPAPAPAPVPAGGGGGNGPVNFGVGPSILPNNAPVGNGGAVLGASVGPGSADINQTNNNTPIWSQQSGFLSPGLVNKLLVQHGEQGSGQVLGSSVIGMSEDINARFLFLANLRRGNVSLDVTELQKRLIAEGYNTQAVGHFGPLTLAAVKLYQTNHSIISTGFVGPLTRAELNK